ncbi:MAG: ATP-binding protein [Bacteroidia bacterium]
MEFIFYLDRLEIHFDQKKWDKIIYNLLSNAIKFTPKGGCIQVSIDGKSFHANNGIRLKVSDTGMGIAKEQLSQIFNRFYQTNDSTTRLQGGTGIGLALVKELIEMQGGSINVVSELNKGTTFEIYLPEQKAEESSGFISSPTISFRQNQETPPIALPKKESSQTSQLELLIVEDNLDMREYIRQCIDENLYQIYEARDGEKGLEKAQALIPDLIISDVMMPKMDGFDLTHAIRNDVSTSHIPLILLTAKTSLESRLKGLQRGADAYLTKPFSPQELTIRIHQLIEIRRSLQKRYQNGIEEIIEDAYQAEDEFIINLRDYVLENIDEPNLNGDLVGQHFAMSRGHLHRKLKALTDQSISEFVKDIRLKESLKLLKEGKYNVSEIAYQTGFSSPSHFSREFKKMYRKTPSEV